MPFKDEVWERPAVGGDVGGIAIDTVAALLAIRTALQKLAGAQSVDISDELDVIQNVSESLDKAFEELSGWIAPYDPR